jgi:hypothetical protein
MTIPSGPQHGGLPAPQPEPRVNQIAASTALGLGFVALSRIGRTRERGRWAAITGIGLGVVFFAILMTVIASDIISPISGQPVNGLVRPRFNATPLVKLIAGQRRRTVATTTCPDARRAQIATE